MNNVLKTDKIHLSKQTPTFGIIMLLRYCLAKVYMSCNETLVVCCQCKQRVGCVQRGTPYVNYPLTGE